MTDFLWLWPWARISFLLHQCGSRKRSQITLLQSPEALPDRQVWEGGVESVLFVAWASYIPCCWFPQVDSVSVAMCPGVSSTIRKIPAELSRPVLEHLSFIAWCQKFYYEEFQLNSNYIFYVKNILKSLLLVTLARLRKGQGQGSSCTLLPLQILFSPCFITVHACDLSPGSSSIWPCSAMYGS